MGLSLSSDWTYRLYVVLGSCPPTIAPQNSILTSSMGNGGLIEPWWFHTFWGCSLVIASFRFLYTRSWYFGIRNAAFNAKYGAASFTFYSAMKIQGLWILQGFRAGILQLIFHPYIKGMGGRPFFPFHQSFLIIEEAVWGAILPIFVSVFSFHLVQSPLYIYI